MRPVRFRCGADNVNAFDRLFPSLVAMAMAMAVTVTVTVTVTVAVAVRLFLLRYRHHIFDLSGDRLFLRVVRSVPIRYGLHIKGILFNCRVILFSGPFFGAGQHKADCRADKTETIQKSACHAAHQTCFYALAVLQHQHTFHHKGQDKQHDHRSHQPDRLRTLVRHPASPTNKPVIQQQDQHAQLGANKHRKAQYGFHIRHIQIAENLDGI